MKSLKNLKFYFFNFFFVENENKNEFENVNDALVNLFYEKYCNKIKQSEQNSHHDLSD